MAILDDLQRYYANHGILATRFACPHTNVCCGNSECFTGPKSAHVGECYENAQAGGLPRLVFVSLDSGSLEANPMKRLPEAVRHEKRRGNTNNPNELSKSGVLGTTTAYVEQIDNVFSPSREARARIRTSFRSREPARNAGWPLFHRHRGTAAMEAAFGKVCSPSRDAIAAGRPCRSDGQQMASGAVIAFKRRHRRLRPAANVHGLGTARREQASAATGVDTAR